MEGARGAPGEQAGDEEPERPPSRPNAGPEGARHHAATQAAGQAREAAGSPRPEGHAQPAKRQRLDDGTSVATSGGEQEPAQPAASQEAGRAAGANRYSRLEAAVAGCAPADLARLANVINSTVGSDVGRLEAAVASCSPADLARLASIISSSWDRRAVAGGGNAQGGKGSWVTALQAAFDQALQAAQPQQAQGGLSSVASGSGSELTGGGGKPGREPDPRPRPPHALASTSGSLPSSLSHLRIPSASPGFLAAPDGTTSAESQTARELGAEAHAAEQQPSGGLGRTCTDGGSEGGSEQLPSSRGYHVGEWSREGLEACLPATSSGPKAGDSSGIHRTPSRNFRVYSNAFQQPTQPAPRQPQPQPQPAWGASRAKTPQREIQRERREEPHARQPPPAALPRAGSSQLLRPPHHPHAPASTARRSEPPPPQAIRPAVPGRPIQPALPSAGSAPQSRDAALAAAAARFAVPTEPEALARWLQQRYTSLGAALSSSEAHLSSLGSHTSATLPLVLARLQAAQELQGRAAAAGGLPAAAALIPLLHFQALAQSIGSSPAASPAAQQRQLQPPPQQQQLVQPRLQPPQPQPRLQSPQQPRHSPPALPVNSPFASLEAWRKSFSPQGVQAAVSVALAAQQEAMRPREPLPAGPAADIYAAFARGRADAAAVRPAALPRPSPSQGREWPSASRWTDPVLAAPAMSQAQAARALPDPHNPFEMHRISLARAQPDEAEAPPPPPRTQLPPAPSDAGAQVPGHGLLEDLEGGQSVRRAHRSAPPFTSRGSGEVRRAQLPQQPTAATVVRTPNTSAQPVPPLEPEPPPEAAADGEDDEQAAETLLSLVGPGGQEEEAAPAAALKAGPSLPVRRQRTQRVPVGAIATMPGRAESRPASTGDHHQTVRGLLGSSLERRPSSAQPRSVWPHDARLQPSAHS